MKRQYRYWTGLRGLLIVACTAGLTLAAASAQGQGAIAGPGPQTVIVTDAAAVGLRGLLPVPRPDLGRLEPIVQEQLTKARGELSAAIVAADPTDQSLARSFGEMGQLYQAHQLGDPARVCYANAARLAPEDFRWPYLLAYLDQAAGRLEQALGEYRQALALKPGYTPAKLRLAQVYIDLNRPEDAIPLLQQATHKEGLEAAAWFGLGRAAMTQRDYKTAVDAFERALALEPEAVRIHYPLAMAYRGLHDIEQARRHIALHGGREPAIPDPVIAALDPLLTGARTQLYRAIKAAQNKQFDVAAQAFREALKLDPNHVPARVRLARTLYLQGDKEGTLEQLREALRRDPDNAEAIYYMGRYLAAEGKDGEAIDWFHRALAKDPDLNDARVHLGGALMRQGDYTAAAEVYAALLKREPQRLPARLMEAMSLIGTDRHVEARMRLEQALEAYPDDTLFRHILARLLASSPDPAARDGKRALELARGLYQQTSDPSDAETLAMAYAETGDFQGAVEMQQQVVASANRLEREDLLPRLETELEEYASKQPWRNPWRGDHRLLRPDPDAGITP